ncbi:SDR family oxidoreductase [Aureispira anguillae]|uniref:SDR family oxidoreductase n=1 Tax=Aureispira anguillae TaxID=2864201 RepID=A0A915YC66_9BACT|nr:SDR family oxidoreductase [Aureispira anguillae]BDS10387.1 SDR family oxidoreductase [Aureispira anguillae]
MKKSKNVVITGASTGIGYATTQALIKKGYRVFGSVRKQADADKLSQEFGEQFEALIFDVTQADAVKREAARVEQIIGTEGLYALINNAGIAVGGPMMHLPLDDLRWQMEVNVIGLVSTTQAFLPLLGAKKDCPHPPGRILNISSVAGKISNPFMGPYCASKHAVEAISNTMRIELLLYGIDVVVIGPGVVKTPIWDKAEQDDFEAYKNTDYKSAAQKFQHFINKVSTEGFEQKEFGEMMAKIIETPTPKLRYPLVYGKLKNWILPRLLPTKIITNAIGKRLGLTKK